RDLYRPDRWFEARPLVIYADGKPVAGKTAELEPLRIRYGLATVTPDTHGHGGFMLGLNVAEAEFLVMQAIIFPGINILWIGCVMLFIGTFIAVWNRVRNGRDTIKVLPVENDPIVLEQRRA
ncbi:MAG: hypothetical protein M3R08_05415, partial [Bacteroidota bacterium]|nr:hypothetical protein [Bacteroidota bacterium]